MNSLLVILITGMAVLGAYYLAELFSEGMEKPKNEEAVLVLPGPVSPAQVLEITAMVRQKLPRCQVIAGMGDSVPDAPMPAAGLRGVAFAASCDLEAAVIRELHLQSPAEDL
ncbi:hypothetical protein H8S23_01655 [Anaerofilum sp. BX8]|uniref:Uncharacterized protein n=1 Tax=Anaerofilum hominis TaxID=2763016 RepID=A0A923L0C2_9FIRM|nr:hypothetical protein [Anaerofilum hominis]MBC5580205.1 hypothetical protein [Anaerofilum hominis]